MTWNHDSSLKPAKFSCSSQAELRRGGQGGQKPGAFSHRSPYSNSVFRNVGSDLIGPLNTTSSPGTFFILAKGPGDEVALNSFLPGDPNKIHELDSIVSRRQLL